MTDNSVLMDILRTAGILAATVLLAWLIGYAGRFAKRRLSAQQPDSTIPVAIDSAVRPLVLLVLVEGVVLALRTIKPLEDWHPELNKVAIGAIFVVATYGLARIIGALYSWQLKRIQMHSAKPIDLSVASFVKTTIQAAVYVIGLLLLLDYLNIPISPLIASLGIGGLAVALALQPTIGNFFAGSQVITDRVARVGDFIEINDQLRGYVTEVGWRSTRIRTPLNNIIIIPNSILANSHVINYNMPNTAVSILVSCGVSYDSDLARVRQIALEVANDVIQNRDEAVKTFEPWVGFDNFGDSNISFGIFVQAKDRLSSFNLKNELIMSLHERFRKENITINYPVRMTYLKWAGENIPDKSKIAKL